MPSSKPDRDRIREKRAEHIEIMHDWRICDLELERLSVSDLRLCQRASHSRAAAGLATSWLWRARAASFAPGHVAWPLEQIFEL